MKTTNKKFMAPLLFTFILQGCMPDSLTKFSKAETKKAAVTTTTTTTTTSPTAAPDLTTINAFQLKNITQNSTSYHLHKYGVGNSLTNCEIPVADLGTGDSLLVDGSSDILCWLEADEVQLFFNGANFQTNAPAGYCEYIEVRPYFYWNAQPKTTVMSVTRQITDGVPVPASATAPYCRGDYTSIGGKNCDDGTITVKTTTTTLGVPVIVDSTIKCGGKRANCLAGPGVDFAVDLGGVPVATDYLAYTGLSINYSVTAPGPSGKGFRSNRYASNFTSFFADATDPFLYDYTLINSVTGMDVFSEDMSGFSTNLQVGETPADASVAVIGIAFDPLKSSGIQLQPFYEFSCLNYAHEVKGRIRLQIREWNKTFVKPSATNVEVSKAAPAYLMKQSLNSADHESSGVGYWNDKSTWDIITSYGKIELDVTKNPNFDVNAKETSYGFSFPQEGYISP